MEIPYGKEFFELHIPDDAVEDIIAPNDVQNVDETQTIEKSLILPIGRESFDSFLENTKNLLIIVNDHTRPNCTSRILDVIQHKIENFSVRFCVATGSHRAPTSEELRNIFKHYFESYQDRIHIHDSRNMTDLVFMGKTKFGTEVFFNRLAVEAQKIVVMGSVEPHYYAGYTGGRKSFLPGIASYRSIEQNHKLAMDSNAQVMVLDGNPVHEDMENALQYLDTRKIFSMMMVLDQKDRIYGMACGCLKRSFLSAVKASNEIFSVKIDQKADIVVVVVTAPLDINLYQSHKALEHARLALKPDGILILVSPCWEGVGPDSFVKILSRAQDPESAQNFIQEQYQLGFHKVDRLVQMLQLFQLWAVTRLDPNLMKSIFMRPFSTVQEAVNLALNLKRNSKVLFIMNGGMTVPYLDYMNND